MLEPVNGPLFAAAALAPGEVVIDVGCGRGATAREAARRVGRAGRVVGIDVSPELIAAARDAAAVGRVDIEWIADDAQRADLTAVQADVVLTRFGVMFFDDDVAGFANLRSGTRPGGRLVGAVWQPRTASPFQTRAQDVALAVAAQHGCALSLPEDAEAPFAFGVDEYVADVLSDAGWDAVGFEPHTVRLYAGGPGASPAEAAALGFDFGVLATLTADLPTALVASMRTAVEHDLAECWDGVGVALDAAIAVVTAVAPGGPVETQARP